MSTGKKAVIFAFSVLLLFLWFRVELLRPQKPAPDSPPTYVSHPTEAAERQTSAIIPPQVTVPAVDNNAKQAGANAPLSPRSPTPSAIAQRQAQPATSSPGTGGKPPAQDPAARVALASVGADPFAEAYWYMAINDPSLSPTERQDLIEDLNEDGLSDPKHPTLDDLPLIASRMAIIEQIGGEAMDQVNADAFQEAYKDLVNLAAVALGGGEPVR